MNVGSTDHWLSPLRERALLPAGTLAAFVVGSAARGWHNARSDFDIYVVSEDAESVAGGGMPLRPNPPQLHTVDFYDENRKWEITYWTQSQVDQALAKVAWPVFESGDSAGDTLTLYEELLLARLDTCIPVVGDAWIQLSRRRLAESAFSARVVVRSLGAADDAVEDALGQLEAGDLESATISARVAFRHVVDALLESYGEYGSHLLKWQPNRVRAVAPAEIGFSDYWRIETMQGYDIRNPGPWIVNVLTLSQDLAMRVHTA